MLDAVRLPRLFSSRVSFRRFTASLVLCSLVLGVVDQGSLSTADWLCPSRSETPESNVEEVTQVAASMPQPCERRVRHQISRIQSYHALRLGLTARTPPAGDLRRAVVLHLESNPLRC